MDSTRLLIAIMMVAMFFGRGARPVAAADFPHEIVDRTNTERVKHGLVPLVISTSLMASAQSYANAMATEGFFSHVGPNGATLQVRDEAAGYEGWDYLAENIASGQTSTEEVIADWLASPDHRANLLSPVAHELGVGYAVPTGSSAGPDWVVEIGDRPSVQSLHPDAGPAAMADKVVLWAAPPCHPNDGVGRAVARRHRDANSFA